MVYVVMSAYICLVALVQNKFSLRISVGAYCLLIFWVIYTAHLLFDMEVMGVSFAGGSNFQVYSFALGNSFLSCIAIILTARMMNMQQLIEKIFYTIFICNVLIILTAMAQNGLNPNAIFANRIELLANHDETKVVLNPITLGQSGGDLLILALSLLLLPQVKTHLARWLLVVALVLGFVVLMLGASRGPFLGTVLLLPPVLWLHFRFSTWSVGYFARWVVVLALIIGGVLQYVIPLVNASAKEIAILERLDKFSNQRSKGQKEYRDGAFASAWQDFKDSPFWGKQFVGTYDDYFPHNIFLEVLMATGIFGGFFFLIMEVHLFLLSFAYVWYSPTVGIIFILFLAKYLLSFSSGCIFLGVEFWNFSALLLSLHPIHIEKNQRFTSLLTI